MPPFHTPGPSAAIQLQVERAFTRLGWTFRTDAHDAVLCTATTIYGKYGRQVVEVSTSLAHSRVKVRVGLGLVAPRELRGEVAQLLAHLNFAFDAAALTIAPSGQIVARARVIDGRPGRRIERPIRKAIIDAKKTSEGFYRALLEVVTGRMTADEVLEVLVTGE